MEKIRTYREKLTGKKKMIDRNALIEFFNELSENYEKAGLPSWLDFNTIIEYIEIFPEKGVETSLMKGDI